MGSLHSLEEYRRRRQCAASAPPKPVPGFDGFRKTMQAEVESIADVYLKMPHPWPDHFSLRIARVSYAIYLLDTLEQMLHVVDQKGGERLVSSFESAKKAVRAFLHERYFQTSADEIISGHLRMEGPLSSCASRTGITLKLPEPAVEEYKMKLAEMIDEIYHAHPSRSF